MEKVATVKLYKPFSLDNYYQERDDFIHKLAADFEAKTPEAQWNILIKQFGDTSDRFRKKLNLFIKNRKTRNYNIFNMSYADCVTYFKDFCFVFKTDNPNYKLDRNQTEQFLKDLLKAMNSSEKGLATAFEWLLQLYRHDKSNWIESSLNKARCQVLEHLCNDYLESYGIDPVQAPQTLKIFCALADEHKLGIKIKHYLRDGYIYPADKEQIRQYFINHYPQLFIKQYENLALDILCQQLLEEVNQLVCQQQAIEEQRQLSEQKYNLLTQHLSQRLGLPENSDLKALGIVDNGTPVKLKKNATCYAKFRELLTEKLVKEGYFVNFDNISQLSARKIAALKLRNGVTLDALLELNTGLGEYEAQNDSKTAQLLAKHTTVILQYPEILLKRIKKSSHLISILPLNIKANSHFVSQIIIELNKLLLEAYRSDDHAAINNYLRGLFELAKTDSDLLLTLSNEIKNSDHFALRLVEFDGLLLKILPDKFRQQPGIVEKAIVQNPLALLYAYPPAQTNPLLINRALNKINHNIALGPISYHRALVESYTRMYNLLPEEFRAEFILFNELPINNQECINDFIQSKQQIDAILQLINQPHLSTLATARLSQQLNPELLIRIIQHRTKQHFPPLPYCKNQTIVKHFSEELKEKKIKWSKEYLPVRHQACELYHVTQCKKNNNDIVNYLSTNDYWYLAMIKHHRDTSGAFKNWRQFWEQLFLVVKNTASILFSLAKMAAVGIAGIGLALLANALIANMVSMGLFFGIIALAGLAPIIAAKWGNRPTMAITVFAAIISVATVALDACLGLSASIFIIYEGLKLPRLIKELVGNTINLFARSFLSLFSASDSPTSKNRSEKNVQFTCEEIIARLKLISTPSAQQKSYVLELLLEKINSSIEQSLAENTLQPEQVDSAFAELLDTPYDIIYQNQIRRVSFSQISDTPRTKLDQFIISNETSTTKLSFFGTSSTALFRNQRFTNHPSPTAVM